MRKYFFFFILFLCCLSFCHSQEYKYYSDYFVFIPNPEEKRIILPVAITWEKSTNKTIFREIKGWLGTENKWIYKSSSEIITAPSLPIEWYQVPHSENFSWDNNKNYSKIFFDTLLTLIIEYSDNTHIMENFTSMYSISTSIKNATVIINTRDIKGIVNHEQIRSENLQIANSLDNNRFGKFIRISMLGQNNFYLFRMENGNKQLFHWVKKGNNFVYNNSYPINYEITATETDEMSKRDNIPSAWKFEIIGTGNIYIKGLSHHTGYGVSTGNKTPIYRQQLIEGNFIQTESLLEEKITGMAEIIMDN